MGRGGQKNRRSLRRVGPIVVFGAFVCAGLFARTPVAGMSQHTDTVFEFSFWYPAAWKVTDEPVADPTQYGWFLDATIVKELLIRNPAASVDGDQPPGVILQEISAPKGLTELGQSKSASPVGIDQRYFFDSGTHRWMYAQLSDAPDGAPPATGPMSVTHRTMGGLPLFGGAVRHGGEVIVPLDGSHFLAISTLDVGGDNSHTYLAQTIVPTHPHPNKRESAQMQAETIRREAIKLRATGESLGFWYKDSRYVCSFDGEVLRGADPKQFPPLSRDAPNASFATDGIRVYGSYCGVIPGADSKTFAATGTFSAKDAHHTYDWSRGSVKITGVTARD
jgi:hypothetical protein